jgi:hypothetical protein
MRQLSPQGTRSSQATSSPLESRARTLHGGLLWIWTFIVGEHPGHQTFSRGPWPEYRRAHLGRCHVFRQSTKDSIISVVMQNEGYQGWLRTFEFVVRCDTLLAYADAVAAARDPTTGVAGDAESSHGDEEARVVVGDGDGDVDSIGGCGPHGDHGKRRCQIRHMWDGGICLASGGQRLRISRPPTDRRPHWCHSWPMCC